MIVNHSLQQIHLSGFLLARTVASLLSYLCQENYDILSVWKTCFVSLKLWLFLPRKSNSARILKVKITSTFTRVPAPSIRFKLQMLFNGSNVFTQFLLIHNVAYLQRFDWVGDQSTGSKSHMWVEMIGFTHNLNKPWKNIIIVYSLMSMIKAVVSM